MVENGVSVMCTGLPQSLERLFKAFGGPKMSPSHTGFSQFQWGLRLGGEFWYT